MLVCVDHWMGNDNAAHQELTKLHDVFNHFKKNTEKSGDTIIPMKGSLSKVCPLLKDQSYDFIFIDGDHKYTLTKEDIVNCKRLIVLKNP